MSNQLILLKIPIGADLSPDHPCGELSGVAWLDTPGDVPLEPNLISTEEFAAAGKAGKLIGYALPFEAPHGRGVTEKLIEAAVPKLAESDLHDTTVIAKGGRFSE